MIKPKLDTIVVEDLPDARALLEADLDRVDRINLVGSAGSVLEGLRLIKTVNPDLIFLDIDLPDGTGFDLLELVDERRCSVIFTTASDRHAIQAFRFAAVDYLLKPIDPVLLAEAIDRVQFFQEEHLSVLRGQMGGEVKELRITLANSDEIRVVDVQQIIRCAADDNYTLFYLDDGTRFMVSKTIKVYYEMLQKHGFVRTHQSHLVNLSFVKGYVRADGGYLLMKDESRIPVSVRRKKFVISRLGNS